MRRSRIYSDNLIETYSLSAPVYKTPDFHSDKNILDRISRSYEVSQDRTVSDAINFLYNAIMKSITSIDDEVLSEYFKSPYLEAFGGLLLDLLISSNCVGIVDWQKDTKYHFPLISSVNMTKVRKVGQRNSNLIALIFDYPRELPRQLKQAFETGTLTKLSAYGDFTFLERPTTKNDILPITDRDLVLDAQRHLNQMFIVKPTRCINYSIYQRGRYGEPFIYKVFPYVEVKNALLTAESCFYTGASLVLFLLKTGRKDESISSIRRRLKEYADKVATISRVGLLTAEDTADIKVISGWDIKKEVAKSSLNEYENLIFSSVLQIPPSIPSESTAEIISQAVNSFISLISPLVQKIADKIYQKNMIAERKKVYLPRVSLTGKDLSNLIRLRDRGDISRTTLSKSIGLNIEEEVKARQKEKEKSFDDILVPPYIPFQGKGRPLEEEDA